MAFLNLALHALLQNEIAHALQVAFVLFYFTLFCLLFLGLVLVLNSTCLAVLKGALNRHALHSLAGHR